MRKNPIVKPKPEATLAQFPNLPPNCCVSIIGMAGAGKSTVGNALATHLDWAFVDTDRLIEAIYATKLQTIADSLDKAAFLDLEAEVIGNLRLNRCVLATGGSVIYRESGMARLAQLGPIIHLDVCFQIIEERIARNPQRGLAIAPGQTIQELFQEREELYKHYATLSIPAHDLRPAPLAAAIAEALRQL